MKRIIALLVTLCLLLTTAAAEGTDATQTVDMEKNGVTVIRNKSTGETDTQKYKVEYPEFECDDETLTAYLKQTVTDPLLVLRKTEPLSAETAYAGGQKDYVRMSFLASLDFEGVLSLEASVANTAADQTVNEMLFFYRIVDLNARKELTVYDLFTQPREEVDKAIRTAVYAVENAQGLAIVTDATQVPAPNSIFLATGVFRCLFAAGTVAKKATVVDIPWDQLGLTKSAVLLGNAAAQTDAPAGTADAQADDAVATGDMDTAPQATEDTLAEVDPETLGARLTANDWLVDGQTLHFAADGTVTDPTGGTPLFYLYYVDAGKLYLSSEERADQGVSVFEADDGLSFVFDPETSDYQTLLFQVAQAPIQTQAPTFTQTPATAAPLVNAATPTPLPLTGESADIAAFLAQGLWKPIGTDANTYYQFTPDGKLLTIEVAPYTVMNGELVSDAISGKVETGGTAFTLVQSDGQEVGYVLNRSATAIPDEAFLTATPTPEPTPTPTPSPEPTATPTPTPTPEPTPTLSPYDQALEVAPMLAALGDASFEKRQTLKVYSAPDEKSYRDSKAQVTTDETVSIFGVTGEWVLVSYKIGNGSRGRMGYIADTTLADKDNVAQLGFASMKLKLLKAAKATDDPLYGKTKLFDIKKDTEVTLLAFMGTDWAYVETTYKDKLCRAFIPRTALVEDPPAAPKEK